MSFISVIREQPDEQEQVMRAAWDRVPLKWMVLPIPRLLLNHDLILDLVVGRVW